MSDIAEPDNDFHAGAEYKGVLLPTPYPPPANLPYSFGVLDFATFKPGSLYDWDWYSLTIPQGVQKINITLTPEPWDGSNGGSSGGLAVESIDPLNGFPYAFDTNPEDGTGLPAQVSVDYDVTSLFDNGQPLVTFFFAAFGGKITEESVLDAPNIYTESRYTLTVNFREYINHPTNSLPGSFSALEYIASYPDLIQALGPRPGEGLAHWLEHGFAEGRSISFDALQYIASYSDLIMAFGDNRDAGAAHYIYAGFAEGRASDDFDEGQYLANYADLQQAFGGDTRAATQHYITNGSFEGRTDDPLPTAALDILF